MKPLPTFYYPTITCHLAHTHTPLSCTLHPSRIIELSYSILPHFASEILSNLPLLDTSFVVSRCCQTSASRRQKSRIQKSPARCRRDPAFQSLVPSRLNLKTTGLPLGTGILVVLRQLWNDRDPIIASASHAGTSSSYSNLFSVRGTINNAPFVKSGWTTRPASKTR